VALEDGAVGNMILTELEREAAPYLRYAMNDVVEVRLREDAQGRRVPFIRVVGRADDMLIVKGVNIFPAAIQNIVAGFAPRVTGALRIDLDRPPPLVTPPLRLRIEQETDIPAEALPGLAREIEEKIRMMLNVRPAIAMVPAGSLGRSVRKTALIHRTDLPQPAA
jgi:phenylacetate-CoA ligase